MLVPVLRTGLLKLKDKLMDFFNLEEFDNLEDILHGGLADLSHVT